MFNTISTDLAEVARQDVERRARRAQLRSEARFARKQSRSHSLHIRRSH